MPDRRTFLASMLGENRCQVLPRALTLCVAYNSAGAPLIDTEVGAECAIEALHGVAKHRNNRERRTGQDLTLVSSSGIVLWYRPGIVVFEAA